MRFMIKTSIEIFLWNENLNFNDEMLVCEKYTPMIYAKQMMIIHSIFFSDPKSFSAYHRMNPLYLNFLPVCSFWSEKDWLLY